MKKKLVLFTVLLSLVLSATACGNKEKASKENQSTEENANAETTSNPETDELLAIKTADEGEIELGEYKGITVEYADTADTSEITDEEVETQINSFLEKNKTSEDIKDRAVKEGDTVNIDYKGTKDGEAFDGGTAEGYDLVIGSDSFIDGFEDGLIGAEIGETKKLNLTFPEEYNNEELAGQKVVFEVKINSISLEKTPKLTDEFVAEKTEYKTVDEYKAGVKADLQSQKEWTAKFAKWDTCWEAAVKNVTVKAFSKQEVEDLKQEMTDYYTQMAEYYGMTLEDYVTNTGSTMDDFNKEAEVSARTEAKKRMTAKKIAELENITVTDDDYKNGVTGIRKAYGYETDEDVIEKVTEERLKENFLTYKVEELIANNAKIVAPPKTEAPAATAAADSALETESTPAAE